MYNLYVNVCICMYLYFFNEISYDLLRFGGASDWTDSRDTCECLEYILFDMAFVIWIIIHPVSHIPCLSYYFCSFPPISLVDIMAVML